MKTWARYRIENPDRKNCIEQHKDFKAFRKEAEEVAVFVNLQALTEEAYDYFSSELALMIQTVFYLLRLAQMDCVLFNVT